MVALPYATNKSGRSAVTSQMRSLPDKADIVVVGAGVVGASIGYQLAANSSRRVVVVDARPPVGGVSGRTFGQVRQHYSNELTVRMALRGMHCIRNWAEEVGHGGPGYVPLGYLLMVGDGQLDSLKRNIDLGRSLGVDTRLVEPGEMTAVEPLLDAAGIAGGAYEPQGGYIDVTCMVLSWLSAANAAGARLLAPLTVEEISTSAGSVCGVVTPLGEIRAPMVVMATGAWARDLLDPLGAVVPITRRRLDMTLLAQAPGTPALATCVTDGVANLVIRPDMGTRLLAAAYPSEMPEVQDPLAEGSAAAQELHMERVRYALRRRLPALADVRAITSVSGAYDITPDYHPILGWADSVGGPSGLYMAVGFSGHGLKLSPTVGEIAAAALLGVEQVGSASPIDASALEPGRFTSGRLMHLAYGPSARA